MVGVRGHGYTEGGLSLLPLDMTRCSTPGDTVCKQTLGQPNNKPNKVILLFGDDQSSKGSFKDAVVNYVFDVQINDTHRLILMDDYMYEGDPDIIKVYIINNTEGKNLPFNIILVDLPALGSVGEAERDVRIMQRLEEFLRQDFGTTLVDSINLVVSSSSDQLYTLDNTYKLLCISFSHLESITQILVTESTSYMPLLNSLKECNIRYRNFFIFNNGHISSDISEEEKCFIQIFQHFDYHGVEDFFQELGEMSAQNMSLGKYVEGGCVDIQDVSRLRILHRYSETVGSHGSLTFRQLAMETEYQDESMKTEVLTLGRSNNKPTKAMLLMGNKLAGKTTLLTAIVNHIFGVKYHDNFRLLVNGDPLYRLGKQQDLRKTKLATAYRFNVLPSPYDQYNFIIIDTPGLKSTEDQSHNKHLISGLISLRHQCGIQQYDVIAYVAPAKIEKFPDSYRSVYKHLYSLLTDEWSEKLVVLATQSDVKRPLVVTALRNLGLPILKMFKFNCHSILSDVHLQDDADPTHQNLCQLYWNIEDCSLSSLCAEMIS